MKEEKFPNHENPEEFTTEELIALFGDDQDGFNAVVTTVLELPESEQKEKIAHLKIVAEQAGLKFPTDADIQRKRAEFAAEELSNN